MSLITTNHSTIGSFSTQSSSIYGPVNSTSLVSSHRTINVTKNTQNTPAFKVFIRNHSEFPMNPYTYERVVVRGNEGWEDDDWRDSYQQKAHYQGQFAFGRGPSSPQILNVSAAELSSLDSLARTKVLLALKDQKANLVQAYAERSQMFRLIGDSATKIAKSLHSLKQGRLDLAAAALGLATSKRKTSKYREVHRKYGSNPKALDSELSSRWLELQYGWSPLLSDIHGLAELTAQKVNHEVIDRVSSSSKKEVSDHTVEVVYGWTIEQSRKTTTHIKYVLYYTPVDETAHTLTQLGVTNPLLIAWELLPWSFVIDWFIPIGNYIGSLDSTNGARFLKGVKTTTSRCVSKRLSTMKNVPFAANGVMNGRLESSLEQITMNRIVLLDFPQATFPPFKNPLSLTHAANAIALLILQRK